MHQAEAQRQRKERSVAVLVRRTIADAPQLDRTKERPRLLRGLLVETRVGVPVKIHVLGEFPHIPGFQLIVSPLRRLPAHVAEAVLQTLFKVTGARRGDRLLVEIVDDAENVVHASLEHVGEWEPRRFLPVALDVIPGRGSHGQAKEQVNRVIHVASFPSWCILLITAYERKGAAFFKTSTNLTTVFAETNKNLMDSGARQRPHPIQWPTWILAASCTLPIRCGQKHSSLSQGLLRE